MLNISDLTVEYRTDPLGMDDIQPRFSRKLTCDQKDTRQTACRVTVSNGSLLWDSGKMGIYRHGSSE